MRKTNRIIDFNAKRGERTVFIKTKLHENACGKLIIIFKQLIKRNVGIILDRI